MTSTEAIQHHPGQRGDMLLEALIATALVIFLGFGLTFAVSKVTVAQRGTNVHTLTVAQLRSNLQTNGFTSTCTASTTTTGTAVSFSNIASGVALSSVTKDCDSQDSNVTVGGTTMPVQVPHVEFKVTDSTLLGSGKTLKLTN